MTICFMSPISVEVVCHQKLPLYPRTSFDTVPNTLGQEECRSQTAWEKPLCLDEETNSEVEKRKEEGQRFNLLSTSGLIG